MLIVEHDDCESLIVVKGPLDHFAASALAAEIAGVRSQPSKRVIVSLERCSRFSDAALSVLSDAKDDLAARFLVIAPRAVRGRKILERRGFVDNLSICKSVREARAMAIVA